MDSDYPFGIFKLFLSNRDWTLRWNDAPVQEDKKNSSRQICLQNISMMVFLMFIFEFFFYFILKCYFFVCHYESKYF